MMKKNLLTTILLFSTIASIFGQTKIDSVEVYSCNYSISRSNGKVDYVVNGEKSNEETITKIHDSKQKLKSLEVCHLTYIKIDGTKITSGIYYPKCNTSLKKSPKIKIDSNSQQVSIKSQGCKDGKWILYNSKGRKKRKAEYYDKGKKIK